MFLRKRLQHLHLGGEHGHKRELINIWGIWHSAHGLLHHAVVVHAVSLYGSDGRSCLVRCKSVGVCGYRLRAVSITTVLALRCCEEAGVFWVESSGRTRTERERRRRLCRHVTAGVLMPIGIASTAATATTATTLTTSCI
jgi:hypothetical protein